MSDHGKRDAAKEKAHDVKEAAKEPIKEANLDIATEAASIGSPEPVSSANVGKDPTETTKVDKPAEATAEAGQQSSLLAGPILRYTRQSEEFTLWHGSVMVVLATHGQPTLELRDGVGSASKPEAIWDENERHFWRFDLQIKQGDEDREVHYQIRLPDAKEGAPPIERSFWVCRAKETFHILFHSCKCVTFITAASG